jgi:hypothetical protein
MRISLAVALICVAAASGCSRSGTSATAPVKGTVTYNGAPAGDVRVIFTPESGRPAIGDADSEGRYVLTTFEPGDGAVPGKHKVSISDRKRNWLPDPVTNKPPPPRFPEPYQRTETTPWTFEVKSDTENVIDLEMVE